MRLVVNPATAGRRHFTTCLQNSNNNNNNNFCFLLTVCKLFAKRLHKQNQQHFRQQELYCKGNNYKITTTERPETNLMGI